MSNTTRRHALYEHARDSWGAETAETLMDLLPPVPDNLATKTDLAVVAAELHTDMADLRTELRTDMADLRTELRTEMADLRTELRTESAALRTEMGELRADVAERLADQTRTLMIAMITTMLSGVGLAFAAAHFA